LRTGLRRLLCLMGLCLALGGGCLGVQAQTIVRPIPVTAAFGKMSAPANGYVTIDKYMYHLAPGLVIRDQNNFLVLVGALQNLNGTLYVRYLTDMNGDVQRIWILTNQELAVLDPKRMPPQPLPLPSNRTTAATATWN